MESVVLGKKSSLTFFPVILMGEVSFFSIPFTKILEFG